MIEEYDTEKFELLCRKGTQLSAKQVAPLRCRYVTNDSPFLKIGPVKVEEHSLNPYIVVYHDLIYDEEIEYIQEEAKPQVYCKQYIVKLNYS